ncbi:hypothetical protein [Texcoconibacillus texcoconensis]|uniref:HTH gntR-type domain-containing protein n=1 Tax=Texcoconibacillus texcoconensis TaxID=1095777 RepID=A0A840QNS5_9BACI|nr:hypothetical protein [Texcoconibacillus texcoconensis]MBB5173024.1 hypothetical protein [Texcoconibacillus texcoconensis]
MSVHFLETDKNHYDHVLYLIIATLEYYASQDVISPTISDLSAAIGVSEESILESLEFGTINQRVPTQ